MAGINITPLGLLYGHALVYFNLESRFMTLQTLL